MKSAYRVIAALIALGVVVQAASVAYAAFSLSHAVDDGATLDKNSKIGDAGFIVHSLDGQVIIPLLAIALLVVSFRAGVPDGRRWAGFVFLAVAVQVALGLISHSVPALGWLHGINALVLIFLAVYAAQLAARTASLPID
jgi:hypothetical protein